MDNLLPAVASSQIARKLIPAANSMTGDGVEHRQVLGDH
jgi:hypothetical protein